MQLYTNHSLTFNTKLNGETSKNSNLLKLETHKKCVKPNSYFSILDFILTDDSDVPIEV